MMLLGCFLWLYLLESYWEWYQLEMYLCSALPQFGPGLDQMNDFGYGCPTAPEGAL